MIDEVYGSGDMPYGSAEALSHIVDRVASTCIPVRSTDGQHGVGHIERRFAAPLAAWQDAAGAEQRLLLGVMDMGTPFVKLGIVAVRHKRSGEGLQVVHMGSDGRPARQIASVNPSGVPVEIGRADVGNVRHNEAVSQRHARLAWQAGMLAIADLSTPRGIDLYLRYTDTNKTRMMSADWLRRLRNGPHMQNPPTVPDHAWLSK